jgi:hypothetical protein
MFIPYGTYKMALLNSPVLVEVFLREPEIAMTLHFIAEKDLK